MASKGTAVLNPGIASIEKGSMMDQLYTGFVDMVNRANNVEAPDFTTDPPMKKDAQGNQLYDPNDPVVPLVDIDAINAALSEYAEIQTKNYAYDMANSIMGAMSGGGDGSDPGSGGFLPISGGSMTGRLSANHGVELGENGKVLITITHDGDGNSIGYFKLPMEITGNVTIEGQLSLDDVGIWWNKHQTIFVADETLNIDYTNVKITGATEIAGIVTIGNIVIDGNQGIKFGDFDFYHAGNSNTQEVDWSMKDGHVFGDLTVEGKLELKGRLKALHGFDLGEGGESYFYSSVQDNKVHLWLGTDLTILGYDNGIKFDDHYIIKTRSQDHNVISFCAPGRVLNLGDTDDVDVPTTAVALQCDFRTADGLITLITPTGKGFFRGFSATPVDSAADVAKELVQGTVIATYVADNKNRGVVFRDRATFYDPQNGPSIFSEDGIILNIELPYIFNNGDVPITEKYLWTARWAPTSSPFKDPQSSMPSLEFNTDGQFFSFSKPVEAEFFAIKSEKHQTRLADGVLFLDNNNVDGNALFLEATGNAIFHSGNATFNHSLSSVVFTSGMAGSGWAILEEALTGSWHATFDELTVRKSMRIYALEVQKINVTNGSWWVTDSCAGDIVEEIK